MAFQPSEPGCIEVVFRFTLFGIPLVVVLTVCLDTGLAPTPSQLNAVATAADNWMMFDMMPELSKDLRFIESQATDISSETGGQVTISHGSGILGSIDSPSLPSQIAVVVTYYTALRGRSYRGRSFLPGIPQYYQTPDTNLVTTGGQTNLLSAANAIGGRLSAVSAHQAVLSRWHNKVKRPVALSQAVTSRNVDATFDTMRRRSANAHKS